MTHNLKTFNSKLIIDRLDNMQTFSNGIRVAEARGKKDIVRGKIIIDSTGIFTEGTTVWYPLYAALPIAIDAVTYDCVDMQDIILADMGGLE